MPLTATGLIQTNKTEDDVIAALNRLFLFHTAEFGDFYNALYLSSLRADGAEFDASGKMTVFLSGEIKLTKDVCDKQYIMTQLVQTIRQFPGVIGNPSIQLNGVGIKNFLQ